MFGSSSSDRGDVGLLDDAPVRGQQRAGKFQRGGNQDPISGVTVEWLREGVSAHGDLWGDRQQLHTGIAQQIAQPRQCVRRQLDEARPGKASDFNAGYWADADCARFPTLGFDGQTLRIGQASFFLDPPDLNVCIQNNQLRLP